MSAGSLPLDTQERTRWVYFIRTEGHPFVKIGMSDQSVDARLRALQVGSPYELVVEHLVVTPDAGHLESVFHRQFEHLHVRGEWFRLEGDLLDYLMAREPVCTCPVCTGAKFEFTCMTCRSVTYRNDTLLVTESHDIICYECTRRFLSAPARHADTCAAADQLLATSAWHTRGHVAA